MYRISGSAGGEPIIVNALKSIAIALGAIKPGRYDIDEIVDDSLATGMMLRRWGIGIKWTDGSFEIEIELVNDGEARG
jgi:hypothetical protein